MLALILAVIAGGLSAILHGEFPHLDEVLLGGILGALLDILRVLKRQGGQ